MTLRLTLLSAALGLAFATTAHASLVDNFAFGFSPRTGDAWVDAQLGDMNVYARGDTDGFIDDVVVSFGAPRYLVRQYVVDRHWAPADVYYGCALAYQLHQPCEVVLRDYEKNHGQGWGVIAQRMGIKPGSAAFHALKGDVGRSNGKLKAHGHGADKAKSKGPGNSGAHGPSSEHGPGNDGDHGPGNSGEHGPGNSGKGKGKKGGR